VVEMKDKSDNRIPTDKRVKAYLYGDTLEMTTAIGPPGKKYIPLGNGKYRTLDGEIKEMKVSDNKGDNLSSLKKTFKRLRRLIMNNFKGGDDQLWLTLTYAENMQDVKRLVSDFRQFIKKLRRKYGQLEYISVIEPQERGAWHYHVLLKTSDGSPLYIENDDIYRKWKHGFTKTKRLSESDNVAAYVMAYLTDMDMNENDENAKSKKIVKGMRLHYYPSNMQFYRCSAGIKQPKEIDGEKNAVLINTLGQYFDIKKYRFDVNKIEPNFHGERTLKGILEDGSDLTVETEYFNIDNLDLTLYERED
jgi:hypothetical protein